MTHRTTQQGKPTLNETKMQKIQQKFKIYEMQRLKFDHLSLGHSSTIDYVISGARIDAFGSE